MLNVEIVIHNELARFIALKREPSAPSEKLLRFVERSAEASVEKLLLVALDGDAVEKQHHTVCRVFRRPVVRGILVCGRVAVELPYLPEKLLGVELGAYARDVPGEHLALLYQHCADYMLNALGQELRAACSIVLLYRADFVLAVFALGEIIVARLLLG